MAERCNLACPYCYYFFQENNPNANRPLIDRETIVHLAQWLRRGAHDLALKNLFLGLHGGEPLLLPKKRFDEYVGILRQHLDDRVDLAISIQTNGTLIDAEWIDLFEKHRIIVGISLDGPEPLHDASRPDHKGRGSYQATVRGLRLVQEAVAAGRLPPTGILCVANPEHDGEAVARHIIEDLGIDSFNLLLPREGHDSPIWRDQQKWIAYFRGVMKAWQASARDEQGRRRQVVIYLLSRMVSAMTNERRATENDWLQAGKQNIITISSEGHIQLDDNVIALDDRLCRTDQTIFDTELLEFVSGDLWQELVHAVQTVPTQCSVCDWLRSCRSGYLYNRYSKQNGFLNASAACETLDALHHMLLPLAAEMVGIEAVAEILGRRPDYQASNLALDGNRTLMGAPFDV
nr:radical SAM protein [Acanthopleuribacter pedis]